MKLVISVVLATACAGTSSPRPPAEAGGRAERVKIGDLEAYALEDGYLSWPNDGQVLGVGQRLGEIAELLAAAGLPRDTIRLDLQCLLVKAGGRVILFDAGAGGLELSEGVLGILPRSLALAHVAPSEVTDIFISHAHGDHVGGLVTMAGALVFPAATIHLSTPEWTELQANPDSDRRRIVAAIAAKVSAFEPGAQVLPVVRADATPGHTPGHSSYWIGTGADQVYYLGDIANHAVISVQRPLWSALVDGDHAAAEAMRQATLAKLATDHVRVFAAHFPFPGLGQVSAVEQGYVWTPDGSHDRTPR